MLSQHSNFDRVAGIYRWMEYLTFGRALERCRGCLLARLAGRRRGLVLGDGDGRFVASLLAANREVEVDAVDGSGAMLALLRKRVRSAGAGERVRTFCGDAMAFEFAEGRRYDLVATHFFLDCLTQREVEALCGRIVERMDAGALWVVSEFRIPEGAMRWLGWGVVRGLYFGFRVMTGLRVTRLPDYARALQAVGLVRVAQRLSIGGMLTAEVWQLGPAGE